MCQALAAYVLGPGIEAFGSGPDGGREATFHGRVRYPSLADPWDGFAVVQDKFKERLLGTGADTTWLRRQVMAELKAWAGSCGAQVTAALEGSVPCPGGVMIAWPDGCVAVRRRWWR